MLTKMFDKNNGAREPLYKVYYELKDI